MTESGDLGTLLSELEGRLRAFGAPAAGALRPGLSPDRVRAALPRAHEDILTWWGWHDGSAAATTPPGYTGPGLFFGAETALVAPWHLLSLDDAVRIRSWLTQEDATPEAFVPVLQFEGQPVLCVGEDGAVHVVDEGVLQPSPAQFASLAELVALLVGLFDAGLVGTHPEDDRVPWLELAALSGDARRLLVW